MTPDSETTGKGREYSVKLKLSVAVVSAVLCAMVLALVGEWAVRYREAHRDTVPGTFQTIYYRHARLGHALARNTDYYGWIHVNSHGFRGEEIDAVAEPGVFRIMTIGASTTFDVGVTGDSRAWPARLEAVLNERAPVGVTFQVVNAGVPGYYMLDHLIRYQMELYDFRPDLIILYATHNDLFGVLRAGLASRDRSSSRPGEMPAVTPWRRWLESHSLLYSKLYARLQAIQFGRVGGGQSDEVRSDVEGVLARGQASFARNARAVISAITTDGIPLMVPRVVHMSGDRPAPASDDEAGRWRAALPFAEPSEVLRGYRMFGDTLAAIASEWGAVPVETAGFPLGSADYYVEGDPIHFNDGGADLFAASLAPVVLEWMSARQASQPVN